MFKKINTCISKYLGCVIINKKTVTFIIFVVTAMITVTSQSMVNTSLEYIMRDFSVNASHAQLVYTTFLLVMGVIMPSSAYIINRFKLKRILAVSLTSFIIGSVIVYFSTSFWTLILGRILEAACTGILLPTTQTLVFKLMPKEKWNFVMGIYGIIIGVMPAFGPTIGGSISETTTWRNIFLILIICAVIMLILEHILISHELETKDYSLDFISLILSVFASFGIMFGFTNITHNNIFSIYVILPIIIGIISLILFVRRQNEIENSLLNLNVLKNISFDSGVVYICLLYFSMCSINILMPLYNQNIAYYSATISGIILLPATLVYLVFNFIGNMIMGSIGIKKLLIISSIISTVGFLSMTTYTLNSSIEYLIVTQSFRSVGAGLGLMPATTWAMSIVYENVEDASAIINSSRQIVAAIGSSISAVILTLFINGDITHNIQSLNGFSNTSVVLAAIMIISLAIVIFKINDKNQSEA